MFSKIAIAALFAGIAAAYHAPVGDPSGNPITRPLNEIVPAGKAFTITWEPTTTNKVSILLLKGPSTNVVPIQTLVEGLDNSGSFTFTPSASLEATSDATGYGIQLIDDVTGQYQYSTQFGISVSDKPAASSAAPVAAPSSAAAGYPVASEASSVAPAASTYAPVAPVAGNTTLATSCSATSTSTVWVTPAATPAGTGSAPYPSAPAGGPAAPYPSGGAAAPSGVAGPSGTGVSPSASAPAEFTGAASSVKAGLGLVGAVAGLVFML